MIVSSLLVLPDTIFPDSVNVLVVATLTSDCPPPVQSEPPSIENVPDKVAGEVLLLVRPPLLLKPCDQVTRKLLIEFPYKSSDAPGDTIMVPMPKGPVAGDV